MVSFLASLVVPLVLGVPSPQTPQTDNELRVRATNAVTHSAIEEVFIQVTTQDPTTTVSAVSAPDGWTEFASVQAAQAVNGEEVYRYCVVEAHRVGFVPLKKEFGFSEHDLKTSCTMVPLSAGVKTPLVTVADGATLSLPGIGTLTVPPGVLTQDVHLHIISMPFTAWPTGLVEGSEQLRGHLWIHATDVLGQIAPTAIPAAYAGITLETELPFLLQDPVGATSQTWTAHTMGDSFLYENTTSANVLDDGTVHMPIANGHNVLTHNYEVAATTGQTVACGPWGPWKVEVLWKSSRKSVTSTVTVSCGRYTGNGGATVKKGAARTGEHTISSELATEYGSSVKGIAAEVSAKTSAKVSASTTSSTTTTYAEEGNASVVSQGFCSFEPGAGCTDSVCECGSIWRRYTVWAKRRRVCSNGTINTQSKDLGEFEMFGGVSYWFHTTVWNPNCAGCAATGTPPVLPKMK